MSQQMRWMNSRKRNGVSLIGAAAFLTILAAAGGGAWWWWQHRDASNDENVLLHTVERSNFELTMSRMFVRS
jgi:hypothetical protein